MMNRRYILIIFLLVILTHSCRNSDPVYDKFNGFIQGTTYSIVFENNGRFSAESLKADVEKLLHDFDRSLSLYDDSSIVSRINRNEQTSLDEFFKEAFEKSKVIYDMTDGAFDITVGPLVKAWGFGPDSRRDISETKKDSLLQLVGMNKVEIRNGSLHKVDPRINLDFNAIAQGYSVDVVCRFFDRNRIGSYLVEIGGEVRVKGKKGDALWRIGIDRPEDNNMIPGSELEAIITLQDRSLATSGNYRKFYVENGTKYSHTIDPKTGYPARNQLLSATIIADDCATADGIATACMVMGKDKAVTFIETHPEYDAYLIFSDESGNFRTWSTSRLSQNITEAGN